MVVREMQELLETRELPAMQVQGETVVAEVPKISGNPRKLLVEQAANPEDRLDKQGSLPSSLVVVVVEAAAPVEDLVDKEAVLDHHLVMDG